VAIIRMSGLYGGVRWYVICRERWFGFAVFRGYACAVLAADVSVASHSSR
jgi:hypothetical protein